MRANWIKAAVAGIFLLLFLAVLIIRPDVFVYPIWKNPFIPLGNLLFWLALIAFPVFLDAISLGFTIPFANLGRAISRLFGIALLLAVLWWPVSYLLAGNFANNFRPQDDFVGSTRAAKWFWAYSYSVVFLPIVLWLGRVLLSLAGRFRK